MRIQWQYLYTGIDRYIWRLVYMTFCQNFENFGVALGIYDEKSSDFSSRKQFLFNVLRWKQKKIPAELKKRCWQNYLLFRNVNFGRRRRQKIGFWKVSKENCFFISTFGYIWRFGKFWKFWRNFGYIWRHIYRSIPVLQIVRSFSA